MSGFRIEGIIKETNVSKITADRRLWLTADGELVEDGDSRAAFLWAVEGREVSAEEAKRLGYKPAKASMDADEETVCDVDGCDFVAKSPAGLAAHKRSHDED